MKLQTLFRTLMAFGVLHVLFIAPAHANERTLLEKACSLVALPSWSDGEAWAWDQICAGRIANMSKFSGDGIGCDAWSTTGEMDPWPDKRVLSANFVRMITTYHSFTNASTRSTVRIKCATVDGHLDFTGDVSPMTLWLQESRITDRLTLHDARFKHDLNLKGSDLGNNDIDAKGLQVGDDIYFDEVRAMSIIAIGAKVGEPPPVFRRLFGLSYAAIAGSSSMA